MLTYNLCADEFITLFDEFDRSENFTRCARYELFQYLDDLSEDMDEDINIDIIGLCCEWSEYTVDELLENFDHMLDDEEREKMDVEALVERLQDATIVITVSHGPGTEDTYLIMDF